MESNHFADVLNNESQALKLQLTIKSQSQNFDKLPRGTIFLM